MELKCFLYVSDSALAATDARAELHGLVEKARLRNAADGVTGTLVFTEVHFAQYVEGPTAAMDDLIGRLKEDRRHRNVDVLKEAGCSNRMFANWSLGYSGPEYILARGHDRRFAAAHYRSKAEAAEDLIAFMQLLVGGRAFS